jgi:hypothetical protein
MQDCISLADSLTLSFGWSTVGFMIASLMWMVYTKAERRTIFSGAIVILLHPMFWGRFSNPCTTDLQYSIVLFVGLWVAVLLWSRIRPKLEIN